MRIPYAGLAIVALFCATAGAQTEDPNPLDHSRVFTSSKVQPHTNPNGSVTRNFFSGTLATGESIGIHASVQPSGTVPPALHRIQHSEFIVIEEGTVAYHHDGLIEQAGAGDVLYVKFGTNHFVSNVGGGPARYVVIQIGGDTKK
jgi:Mannose-6-phosphate isomerase